MVEDQPRRLSALRFRWRARFGFFLRAEAAAAGFGYPVPPRTAVLGVIANVLGLTKDGLADTLADARVAVSGALPSTHWHNGNYRKEPPVSLSYTVRRPANTSEKVSLTAPEKNTQLRQEWLIAPDYELTVVLPDAHHADLARRLREGSTHFTPCMGLSEMLASVEYVSAPTLDLLPEGEHLVRSVLRVGDGTEINVRGALASGLHVLNLSMPRAVTADRRFSHATFMVERKGRPIPCRTREAYSDGPEALVFL